MLKEDYLKSKVVKILFIFIILISIFYLIKNGYIFGQWLHEKLN